MGRAIEVWEDDGGARMWIPSERAQPTRYHEKLRIGVLCTMVITVVLTVLAKRVLRLREDKSAGVLRHAQDRPTW